jgi:hypothetical protein
MQFMYLLYSRPSKILRFDIDKTTTLCDSISAGRHYPDVHNIRRVTQKFPVSTYWVSKVGIRPGETTDQSC